MNGVNVCVDREGEGSEWSDAFFLVVSIQALVSQLFAKWKAHRSLLRTKNTCMK